MQEKLKVMIIEDEPMLLFAIKKKMQKANLDTLDFSNAKGALEYLDGGGQLPSAIWLDYYLKDMNGIEFMHKLKANEKLANIPVLVVSNSASDEKVSSMMALGVKKYFLKANHKLEEIIEDIERLVSEKK